MFRSFHCAVKFQVFGQCVNKNVKPCLHSTNCNSFKNPGRKVSNSSNSTDKGVTRYPFSRTSSPRLSLSNFTRKEVQSFNPWPSTESTSFHSNSSKRDFSKNLTWNFPISSCKSHVPRGTLEQSVWNKTLWTLR